MGSVWGSAGGVLFSWEPFDFGYRHETVKAAEAIASQASAEAGLTRLEVAAKTVEAFLNLLAAGQRVRSARADVERRQVFGKSVHVLVDNQLRPGADASRADAELAAARTRLIEAQAMEQAGEAGLAATLGIAGNQVKCAPGPLLELPPEEASPGTPAAGHPLAVIEKAKIEENSAKLKAVERSYGPHLNLESTVYGRGSGARVDGSRAGGLNGLGLERTNWAAGLTVTFPLAEIASLRARRQIAAANERAEQARYNQVVQDLTGESEKARAFLEGARRVAENTPIELKSARDSESQARARFQAGLGTVVDVAEAQRLLVQAETEDALARLNVWRALEGLAVAKGSLEPFLQLVK
jgi:outer membrane protein TolC